MAITSVYAEFKTGYNQREVRVDAKVASGTAKVKVGELCTLTSAGVLAKKTSATVNVGDVIIAQSDMTLGNGHVPVENHSYIYSDEVALSTTAKPVMVFVIHDVNDVAIVKTAES